MNHNSAEVTLEIVFKHFGRVTSIPMCFCTMHSSKAIVVNIGYLHYHPQKLKAFVEIHEIYPVNIVSFIILRLFFQ